MLYRTATTFYPCCGQALGEFKGSWSYRTYPTAKVVQKYETDKFFAIFLHCVCQTMSKIDGNFEIDHKTRQIVGNGVLRVVNVGNPIVRIFVFDVE